MEKRKYCTVSPPRCADRKSAHRNDRCNRRGPWGDVTSHSARNACLHHLACTVALQPCMNAPVTYSPHASLSPVAQQRGCSQGVKLRTRHEDLLCSSCLFFLARIFARLRCHINSSHSTLLSGQSTVVGACCQTVIRALVHVVSPFFRSWSSAAAISAAEGLVISLPSSCADIVALGTVGVQLPLGANRIFCHTLGTRSSVTKSLAMVL